MLFNGGKNVLDLTKISGLPLALGNHSLIFLSSGVPKIEPIPRKIEELKEVLLNPKVKGIADGYFMYQGIHRKQDETVFQKSGFRYDIMIMPPAYLNQELTKTFGHYHAKRKGTSVGYPEIYEVLNGKAHYLFQKVDENKVLDVKIVEAKTGDKVLVPPDYGHVTINPSQEVLVASNITVNLPSDYKPFKKFRGACFYELSGGAWERNSHYQNNFAPQVIAPPNFQSALGLNAKMPLYLQFVLETQRFDFLFNPQNSLERFQEVYK